MTTKTQAVSLTDLPDGRASLMLSTATGAQLFVLDAARLSHLGLSSSADGQGLVLHASMVDGSTDTLGVLPGLDAQAAADILARVQAWQVRATRVPPSQPAQPFLLPSPPARTATGWAPAVMALVGMTVGAGLLLAGLLAAPRLALMTGGAPPAPSMAPAAAPGGSASAPAFGALGGLRPPGIPSPDTLMRQLQPTGEPPSDAELRSFLQQVAPDQLAVLEQMERERLAALNAGSSPSAEADTETGPSAAIEATPTPTDAQAGLVPPPGSAAIVGPTPSAAAAAILAGEPTPAPSPTPDAAARVREAMSAFEAAPPAAVPQIDQPAPPARATPVATPTLARQALPTATPSPRRASPGYGAFGLGGN